MQSKLEHLYTRLGKIVEKEIFSMEMLWCYNWSFTLSGRSDSRWEHVYIPGQQPVAWLPVTGRKQTRRWERKRSANRHTGDSMKCEGSCITWPESIYYGESPEQPRRQNDQPLDVSQSLSLVTQSSHDGRMSRVDRHGGKNRSCVMSPRAWTPLTNANLATMPLNVHLVSNRDQRWNPSMALFLEKTNQPLNSKLTAWSPSIGEEPTTHPHRDRQTFQVGVYPSCLQSLSEHHIKGLWSTPTTGLETHTPGIRPGDLLHREGAVGVSLWPWGPLMTGCTGQGALASQNARMAYS